jgi:hypothetical protein
MTVIYAVKFLGAVVKGSMSDVRMPEGIRRDQDNLHEPCCVHY